jgi:hypothetical protein
VNELDGQQVNQLLELLVPRAEALGQGDDYCFVGPKAMPNRAAMVAARSNAACREVVPSVQHCHQGLPAAAVGIQRIERSKPILAERAPLVRGVEDQGNMHQRGPIT